MEFLKNYFSPQNANDVYTGNYRQQLAAKKTTKTKRGNLSKGGIGTLNQ